jgi:RHS repeat-associated protein
VILDLQTAVDKSESISKYREVFSGDSDVFNFDPNTGRMTQYKFNVGSNAVTGALTWNPNGTLGQLAITDPLNSANAQTCSYSHDDLVRIATANCTSTPAWSQTFSFDAFGNINKVGNSSFGATYSSSTNRMTTIGSSTPTYDSNGNVTNDFLHTYAWDANGGPVTIDGIGATYDALGRMVELNRSGVYGEIVYAPSGGKLALMNGQSLLKAFVPLPGGATAVYSNSGLAYYRHSDWLGSSRLATTPSQTMYGDVAYAPYGETYAQAGNADFSFTGMNQDVDQSSNPAVLYDFLAREYGIQGRWPSPDPAGMDAVDPSNPQSWNRYAYVNNDPLAEIDPSGMCNKFLGFLADLFNIENADCEKDEEQAPPAPVTGYGSGVDPFTGVCVQVTIGGVPTPGTGGCSLFSASGGNAGGIDWSWWGTFFKGFLSPSKMAKTTYHSFVDEGGCDRLMVGTILEDLSPIPTGGPGVRDVTENAHAAAYAVGATRAAAYAASRGLVKPMSSSIYRSLLSKAIGYSEAAAEYAPGALVVGTAGHGLWNASNEAYNGACH